MTNLTINDVIENHPRIDTFFNNFPTKTQEDQKRKQRLALTCFFENAIETLTQKPIKPKNIQLTITTYKLNRNTAEEVFGIKVPIYDLIINNCLKKLNLPNYFI